MILHSSFGTFAAPAILAEVLRQSIRELRVLHYDPKEVCEFLTKVLANPDSWINQPPTTFSLHNYAEAYVKEQTDDTARIQSGVTPSNS